MKLRGLGGVLYLRRRVEWLRAMLRIEEEMLRTEEADSPDAIKALGETCLYCGALPGLECSYASGRSMGGQVHSLRAGEGVPVAVDDEVTTRETTTWDSAAGKLQAV